MKTKNFFAVLAIATFVAMSSAHADIVVYDDPDPLAAGNTANNIIVNTVDGFTATGDASRALVGEVILTGNTKFVGFNPGPLPLAPELQGEDFTFTMDYFVPTGTTLDENVAGSPDQFWLQIGFDGGNNGSAGFVGSGAAGNGWNTITLTGTLPPAINDITPLFVLADGGFGAGTPNGTGSGTALYVDNFRLTVTNPIPEPSTMALGFIGVAALLVKRRR